MVAIYRGLRRHAVPERVQRHLLGKAEFINDQFDTALDGGGFGWSRIHPKTDVDDKLNPSG
jgi:hypothetical protein